MVIKLIRDNMPLFMNNTNTYSILLDTGASISVFTEVLPVFKRYFKDAIYSGYNTIVGGFGGPGSECPVYIIPHLEIGNSCVVNLPVAVQPSENISYNLILSAYVFKNHPFEIDFKNKEINVDDFNIRCRYKMHKSLDIIDRFVVFTQGDIK